MSGNLHGRSLIHTHVNQVPNGGATEIVRGQILVLIPLRSRLFGDPILTRALRPQPEHSYVNGRVNNSNLVLPSEFLLMSRLNWRISVRDFTLELKDVGWAWIDLSPRLGEERKGRGKPRPYNSHRAVRVGAAKWWCGLRRGSGGRGPAWMTGCRSRRDRGESARCPEDVRLGVRRATRGRARKG